MTSLQARGALKFISDPRSLQLQEGASDAQKLELQTLYKKLEELQKRTEVAAKEALLGEQWTKPTLQQQLHAGLDPIFLVAQDGYLIQGPIHKEIKAISKKMRIDDRFKRNGDPKRGSRNAAFAQLEKHADGKLSTLCFRATTHRQHNVAIFLFRARLHALPTAAKLTILGSYYKDDNPRKKYYQAMWPDNKCHFCPGTVEDTVHVLTCQNVPDADSDRYKCWEFVYEDIRAAQRRKAKRAEPVHPRVRFPFAIRTAAVIAQSDAAWHSLPPATRDRLKACREVRQLDTAFARYGLAPKCLDRALKELSIPRDQRKVLLPAIMGRIHECMHALYLRRCKLVAEQRDQMRLRKIHILGMDLGRVDLDPAPNPDEEQSEAEESDDEGAVALVLEDEPPALPQPQLAAASQPAL